MHQDFEEQYSTLYLAAVNSVGSFNIAFGFSATHI